MSELSRQQVLMFAKSLLLLALVIKMPLDGTENPLFTSGGGGNSNKEALI